MSVKRAGVVTRGESRDLKLFQARVKSYGNILAGCKSVVFPRGQCSKWKFRTASILLKSKTRIYRQKNGRR
jgi:hypothetical protein